MIFLPSSQNMSGPGDFVSRQAHKIKIRPRPSLAYRNNLKKRFYLQLQQVSNFKWVRKCLHHLSRKSITVRNVQLG